MEIRSTGQDREALSPEALVRALEGADPPLAPLRFASIHSVWGTSEDVDEVLAGRFRIGRERLELAPPVDWSTAPYAVGASHAFFLSSLVFADPVLAHARAPEALPALIALCRDWLAANPLDAPDAHRFVRHDHAAAGRLVYLSWILREGIRLGVLDPPGRLALAAGVLEHAAFVAAEDDYADAHNHGLFADAALALAARALAPAPPAAGWAALASARFRLVLERTVDLDDAVHLEHSPYYHWLIHAALGRLADAGLFADLDLRGLADRMEEAGAWFVAPDGTLAAFGDTPSGSLANAAARGRADGGHGVAAFPGAGYAVVRDGGSYLAVTAALHPTGHKHADDGSFVLYEDGRAIVTDSGAAGDHAGIAQRYAVAPAAHSGVTVDGFDRFAAGRPATGSGLLRVHDGGPDGLHAVLVRIPDVAARGGEALRLLLYRPGRWLVVADTFSGAVRGAGVTRRIQLAPDLRAEVGDGAVAISGEGVPVAHLTVGDGDAPDRIEVVRGLDAPAAAGWTLDGDFALRPRDTLVLDGPGLQPRIFALALAGTAAPAASVTATDGTVTVRVREDGVDRYVQAGGDAIVVSERASDLVPARGGGHAPEPRCPICGTPATELVDFNARPRVRCPTCGSLERHRVMHELWEGELRATYGDRPVRALLCSPSQCERAFLFADLETYDLDIGVDRYADLFVDVCDAVGLRDASFDLIVASGILAHVYDLDATLDEWRRILRPGGVLLVTTPVVDGAETVTHDLERRVRLWGPELYERLRIGTYRLPGTVDLYPAFTARFAMRVVDATDPATGVPERVYVLTRPPRTAPAPSPVRAFAEPTDGYAFQRCRVAGRTFAFCLDGPPEAHDLPVTDLLGRAVDTLHVDAFDGTGDYAAAAPEAPSETGCAWPLRARLRTQSRMRPGVYLVDGRIPFVVRHPGTPRVAVVLPSLAGVAADEEPEADVRSFLRPLSAERLLGDAEGVVRWLAETDPFPGETTYLLDVDLEDPEPLEGVELLVVVGRSTHWTPAMRERLDAHVAAGGRLLLLGAEEQHGPVRVDRWRQQLVRDVAGVPERRPVPRRTPESGMVVHGGTPGLSGPHGDAARAATSAMMRLLLDDAWPSSPADDRP